MTDDTTNIEIDVEQLSEYIQQYKNATDREEQHRIENDVLAETVWKTPEQSQTDELTLSEAEVERLHQHIPDEAKEAKRILRSVYIERL